MKPPVNAPALPVSKSQNVYAFSLLKAHKAAIAGDSARLVAELFQIELELSEGTLALADFASRIFAAFEAQANEFHLLRVCLAVNYPLSRRLGVLSSYNRLSDEPNTMEPGYSCFVSPKTSLATIKASNIRTFRDIDTILETYQRDGKPVQRSLGRLKAMGVRSGLTIPLAIDDIHKGFLFLNSDRVGAFDAFRDEDYFLCCVLKVIAKAAMSDYARKNSGLNNWPQAASMTPESISNTFEIRTFSDLLDRVIQNFLGIKVEIELTSDVSERFLYPSVGVAHLCAQILALGPALSSLKTIKLQLTCDHSTENLLLRLHTGVDRYNSPIARVIHDLGAIYGAEVHIEPQFLEIRCKLDLNPTPIDSGVSYST